MELKSAFKGLAEEESDEHSDEQVMNEQGGTRRRNPRWSSRSGSWTSRGVARGEEVRHDRQEGFEEEKGVENVGRD